MLKKLGKSITIANAVAFLVVILIGGVSIFLTKDILHNAYKIEELSKDILTIDSIHSNAYRLVLSIHHFIIDPDELYSSESIEAIASIKKKIEEYKADEILELSRDRNEEIHYLDVMLEDVQGLDVVQGFFKEFLNNGTVDRNKLIDLEDFAYELESTAESINKIHKDRIRELIDESLTNMWIILFIYLIFVFIGGIAIYGGHFLLLRKVVNPIKQLAAATIEFAGGKLDKRVFTDSETEIGQLYESFNRMAEKLQENDEVLRKFNEDLEAKVRERTAELETANEQLRRTQKALIRTEKIAAVGQIAAGVTHEIKNPLNSLSINAQMLTRELTAKFGHDSEACAMASMIRYEINRINDILEEFVKFAKFPEPKLLTNSINKTVSEVYDLVVSEAGEKGIKVQLSLQDSIPDLRFDEPQMKEVLLNLSQNAFRAMPEGGNLEFSTSANGENVTISIKDTGEGIPGKNLEKIFTPFFSTREGGMGLGLPIVQRIIESHCGRITCVSKVGEGTTFCIILPVAKE